MYWLFLMAGLSLLAQDARLDYGRDVRPILSENCFHCHGQDGKRRMAGLRLDVPGTALHKVEGRISASNPALRMPPASSNRKLTDAQIATLNRWIAEGGAYSQHWAFQPPVRPAGDSIDYFVRKRLEKEGLKPNPPASPETWLRRVSLDLTGLPPTPAELGSFAKDAKNKGEAAYKAAVDRLLQSPRYGERMAMDWLDVARYADTHGFNNDSTRSMWRWRDWVIDAFNSNMRYDRFLTEQLAGDLLAQPTLDQRIATGFGRNHVINSEGGIIEEEYRVEYVADRVRTLGMAWLGLTLECAKCHDHKYDPISQKDHYRFFAFFNNVPEFGEDGRVANAVPQMPAPTKDEQRRLAALEAAIAKRAARSKPTTLAALTVAPGTGLAETNPVPLSKHGAVSFGMWLRPGAAGQDTPLFTSIDYKKNSAAVGFGRGIELRLVGSELEFRYCDRLPAYSIRVQTVGAGLTADTARHVALVYEGAANSPDAMRAMAAWVRLYVDGREVETRVLNDGLAMPDAKSDKPSPVKLKPLPIAGEIKEPQFWSKALTSDEVRALAGRKEADLELEMLREQRLALQRNVAMVMVMEELPGKPRETHVLLRGQYNMPGERVEPGVPETLLGPWPAGAPKNRLGLAQWLTKPDHPLTARVVVNRFWQQFFGLGLVKTSDNFGMQGEFPSHPELLDWMAREFIDSGWNVKALVEKIVLSQTYRQDAAGTRENFARDPENRLLSRGPRFRLPAEVIRDQSLFVAGLLKEQVGGPSVFPYQQKDLYKGIVVAADYPGTRWIESKGDGLHRRSMYTFWKRTVPHPTMTVFDAPDREFCIVRRSNTNTPLQALTLLNDPIFVEAARKLAERAYREGGKRTEERMAYAFRLATGRAPDTMELQTLQATYERMVTAYRADEKAAKALLGVGDAAVDGKIPTAELAAYTAVANLILNMDEVITKG
ncbi:MAG TPA: DUF1553 domain-containing protein [Bryobacteraceae bacterium]|nr:DUF1553 domain-containing protein [Bryobacteraceae bacterium]